MHLTVTLVLIALQAFLVIALADFVAGLIHWLEDAYFTAETPVIGPLFIKPNIVHHHLPRYFTRLSWWQSSKDLLLASALLVIVSWPLGFFGWPVILFAILSTNANQIHKWSHQSPKENGRIITALQRWHILQTPRHHGLHHTDPKNTYYCPITNFVNPVLERMAFWPRLEAVIERLTGISHRDDTSNRGQGPRPDWLDEYRHRPSAADGRPAVGSNPAATPSSTRPGRTSALASTRGAASLLAIIGLVIVGWTVGMLLEPMTHHRPKSAHPETATIVPTDPPPRLPAGSVAQTRGPVTPSSGPDRAQK